MSVREEGTWERMWEGSIRVRIRAAGDGVCGREEKELRGKGVEGKRCRGEKELRGGMDMREGKGRVEGRRRGKGGGG